ncbi:MAG TPA: hypothetical protein ENI62_00305 [Gammaproteobacteria bacterium]|nr:hypothetical protein [Gammaproteobacteria bacterium]
MTNEHFQCIIVGAGPAGISLGYHLRKLGIQYAILDQGRTGQSWILMPEKLRLLSPF